VSGAAGGDWLVPELALSSGPFALAGRDAAGLTLVRNPHWPLWSAPGAGNLEQVQVRYAPDAATAAASFEAGEADFARLETAPVSTTATIISAPSAAVTVIGFSTERRVVTNPLFRRALALATDRTALAATLPGLTTAAGTLTAPGALNGVTATPPNGLINADGARAALAEAGFPNCRLPEALDFAIDGTPAAEAVASALIAGWSANLGCGVGVFNVVRLDPIRSQRIANGTFSTIRQTDPFRPHLWLYTWTPDHLDVTAWLSDGAHCTYGYLKTNALCEPADALIDQATLTADVTARAALIGEAEAALFGAAGNFRLLPLYHGVRRALVVPALAGVEIDGALRFDQWQVGG
jgi:ABC-type transport system substrate-binding protein